MYRKLSVAAVIPALNEEEALPKLLPEIPTWVDDIVVADNGSTDDTPDIARSLGARVVTVHNRGYGQACMGAIHALQPTDVVVFMDGDASDDPTEIGKLLDPIADCRADFVIGSRTLGTPQAGSLTPQQIFGNALACQLIRLIWGHRYTDLGPFRAIRRSALESLSMTDTNYGWTIEMQVRALRFGIRTLEVPVSYRRRLGHSKISGTLKGVMGAGSKILYVIAREAVLGAPRK